VESAVPSIDDRLMQPISGDRDALRLLERYTGWIFNAGASVDSQLLNLSACHVHDLLTLAIGPSADFTETARTRGLRAARLKLAKSYIVTHADRRDISIASVAASLNVTPRYVQRLFGVPRWTAACASIPSASRSQLKPHGDKHDRLRCRLR
jgi:hypothetical protein